ncbi:Cullin-domain-containing protein [Ascodesmis nigricans]|uniref:Cullin-1 n=1 Tax=Ascodesmis nigricans TaxID=341454 RepID=A0A4S2MJM9_9PEZI|nr:Cullin-domain-containing protein [Ascodesmis nigricans]
MDVPNKDDLEQTWNYLEQGIEKIMRDLNSGMDIRTYMGVYTAVHNFCTSARAVSTSTQQLHQTAGVHRGAAHLLGEDLYKNLIEYLNSHLEGLKQESSKHVDEALLSYYIREWNRYTTAAKYINHLFKYLNRHWVKREMDEGKKNIYDVYTLHLVQWGSQFFTAVQKHVMDSVLKQVEKQRNGETIETAMVKSIVDSFVSLGLDENDSSKSTLEVYRKYFETPFLEATTLYYQLESKQFVAENSVVEYMKKAETRLAEEAHRVEVYLHPDINGPLMKACEKVLIQEHAGLLKDEFQQLLDEDRQEDLKRMYNLLSRIPGGLDPLRTRFEVHVRRAGISAVDKIAAEGGEKDLDPKVYVDALLEVHTQYQNLVNMAFKGEAEFVRSLDNACREFVNRNQVCKSASTRSPELLAKYADSLLRKSAKSAEEAELEGKLTAIMTVFKYVEDKDVFQKFYSKMLAKRLVNFTSASDDAETSMIGKLKEACGYEYTNKLQRMFQDMQISKDLNDNYKQWLSEKSIKTSVDFSCQVLGTSFWPLNPPNTAFNAPEVINNAISTFVDFYNDKHSGRKLSWLWHLSKGDLKANYCRGAKVPYTFQVSTFQMGVLLLFNDQTSISYESIESSVGLGRDYLDAALGAFVKQRVLLVEPAGSKPGPGTTYSLNFDFKSKKIRVNLNTVVRAEQKQEVEETHKTIEEDRKLLMQSAIVRIMKARKVLKHVVLVQETIAQIKSRFTPKIPDIKKTIDILLEKEYLERLDGERLGYLA